MTDDPAAQQKYYRITEAWAVLGNDLKRYLNFPWWCVLTYCLRKEYDMTLPLPVSPLNKPRYGRPTNMYHSQGSFESFYESRHRGASHAWMNTRRAPPGGTSPRHATKDRPSGSTPRSHAYPRGPHDLNYGKPLREASMRNHFGAKAGSGRTYAESDRMDSVSTPWRAVQVAFMVLIIGSLGGWLPNVINSKP